MLIISTGKQYTQQKRRQNDENFFVAQVVYSQASGSKVYQVNFLPLFQRFIKQENSEQCQQLGLFIHTHLASPDQRDRRKRQHSRRQESYPTIKKVPPRFIQQRQAEQIFYYA